LNNKKKRPSALTIEEGPELSSSKKRYLFAKESNPKWLSPFYSPPPHYLN